jgi:hypothetical protein
MKNRVTKLERKKDNRALYEAPLFIAQTEDFYIISEACFIQASGEDPAKYKKYDEDSLDLFAGGLLIPKDHPIFIKEEEDYLYLKNHAGRMILL